MIIDIALLLVLVAGVAALIFFVSRKIPQLVAISDEVIRERLAEDSARFRFIAVNLRELYRQRGYLLLFLQYFGKILHRVHILFLKIDNMVVLMLRRVREKNSVIVETMEEEAAADEEETPVV